MLFYQKQRKKAGIFQIKLDKLTKILYICLLIFNKQVFFYLFSSFLHKKNLLYDENRKENSGY